MKVFQLGRKELKVFQLISMEFWLEKLFLIDGVLHGIYYFSYADDSQYHLYDKQMKPVLVSTV